MRSISIMLQVFCMIKVLAALVGKQEQGALLIAELQAQIDVIRHQAAQWTRRPKVYFEEWNEPLMSGIGWFLS
jgi:iron complex transport system substrate-binding protein